MDFYSLTRKELQILCKKNNIPANISNVAMAQALADLPHVEGLDGDAQGFEEDKVVATPATRCRTSTRRKTLKGAEGIEKEDKDINVIVTPAMTTSRRRATAISTQRKTNVQMPDDEKNGCQGKPLVVPRTPAAVTTVTRAYNTRRSVRLLDKNLSKMSLMDTEDMVGLKIDDMSEDIGYTSRKTEDLAATEKRPSMQMVSTEYELGSDSENALGASLRAEPQEGLGKPTGKAVPMDSQAETGVVELEDSCDFTESVVNEKCLETKNSELFESPEDASGDVQLPDDASIEISVLSCEVSGDASVEVAALTAVMLDNAPVEETGQDIATSFPMSSENDDSVRLKESAAHNIDNQNGNDSADMAVDASEYATTYQDATGLLHMPSAFNGSVSLKEIVACNTENLKSNDYIEISDALMSLPSCHTSVDGGVITEESANQEPEFSIIVEAMKHHKSPITEISVDNIDEVMTIAQIYEQKTSDAPVQSIVADQEGEIEKNKTCMKKENCEYQNMSIRELKKMLKNLRLDGKSNSKSNLTEEVNRKRTALQALPENQMTIGETQNDG